MVTPSIFPLSPHLLRVEKAEPQPKYTFQKNSSADRPALDSYSFQSITLAMLCCARQDRKIEVSCSRSHGEMEMEMEVKERRGDDETAPQGAETWPWATPPGLSPRWEEEEVEWINENRIWERGDRRCGWDRLRHAEDKKRQKVLMR